MRILHVVGNMDPLAGGPPAVVANLAEHQVRNEHDVELLTFDPSESHAVRVADSERSSVELPMLVPRSSAHYGPGGLHEARAAIARADVVHAHGVWHPLMAASIAAARRAGKPSLVTPHGALSQYALTNKPWKKRLALALGWRRTLNRVSMIHVLQEHEGEDLRRIGVTSPYVVIPNGVRVPSARAGQAGELPPGVAPSERYVLTLCRLHDFKGLDFLIDAFLDVSRRHPDLRLVMAGSDHGAAAALRAQVERLGLAGVARFVGAVHGDAKWALLRGAVCLVQPSRFEAFSVSVLEALACRTPAVISSACHFPELARADAGFMTPVGNVAALASAVDRLVSDPAVRERQAANALELVTSRYSNAAVGAQMLQTYARLVRSAA